jgi:hypothetical protein
MTEPDRATIRATFRAVVNMDADEILSWLKSEQSRAVGMIRPGEIESVGAQSGRRIARILRTADADLDDADYRHMRKVIGFIRRHRAQEPENTVTSRWRYSLMNWGHDPLRNDLP